MLKRPVKTKVCSKCGKRKNTKKFYQRTYDGVGKHYSTPVFQSHCIACIRESHENWRKRHKNLKSFRAKAVARAAHARRKSYGFTGTSFRDELRIQKNRCAICGRKFKSLKHRHADHDHKTKKHRGILCHQCNPAIGLFSDNIPLMLKAIQYIQKWRRIRETFPVHI